MRIALRTAVPTLALGALLWPAAAGMLLARLAK